MKETPKQTYNPKVLLEIVLVLALMIGVKSIFDYLGVNGAGSIGIWSGIVAATMFMKKEGIKWKDLGFFLPKGVIG